MMPVCDICCEELCSEEDMKTHLLLSHTENMMACPLCPLSGVTYDELSFHISTAHLEKDCMETGALRGDLKKEEQNAQHCSYSMTHIVKVNNILQTPLELPSQTNRIATPSTGTSLFQGTSTSLNNSPPAADMAKNDAAAVYLSKNKTTFKEYPISESENGYRKSKQRLLSSPFEEACFPCPMCSFVCSDCFFLQEHVELHLQKQEAAEGAVLYECPMCFISCSSSSSLQEHVDLHLEDRTFASGHSSEDMTLAKRLQEEEEHNWREEQTRREADDFRNLQMQFGLDGSGGYRKQMEKNLDRAVSQGQLLPVEFHKRRAEMLESLASGVDDGKSKTSGIMQSLVRHYQSGTSDCTHVWLCAETDHFFSSEGDHGWGCGYRNFQMLLSCLQRMEPYKLLPDSVPSIPRVQALIEEAWSQGADPQGALHFNSRLQGTRAWIGATEIYAVLTSLCVKSRVVDFHKPSAPDGSHPRLFEWMKKYFTQSHSSIATLPSKVVQTTLPPVYLQHQGHSRSIIGMEQKTNGNLCLLLFDPGVAPGEMRKLLSQDTAATIVRRMRKYPSALKHSQYQVVAVEGVLTPEEKRIRILNSRMLCAEKIP